MEKSASNAYEGDEPNDYGDDAGYHYRGIFRADDELVIERQVFQRFMSRPHAHENGFQ